MIQSLVYPNKIWDLKYNKNNKLLRKLRNLVEFKASTDISKNIQCHYVGSDVFYLFIFYCYCVLIITTPVLANRHNEFIIKIVEIDSNLNISDKSSDSAYNNRDLLEGQERRIRTRQILEASNMPDEEYEYVDDEDDEMDEYELLISNKSAKGMYVGAPCEQTCNVKLHHVLCDPVTRTCNCERNYPVLVGKLKGCAKPKRLGEQCFYHQTCRFNDENSLCVQVSHNALCQCVDGFHSVSYTKPTKRVFCTQDIAVLTSDLPTLLGVTTGIAVLAGLICMVLHLFSKTKYPRHRNFADANIPPPIMYSSDTGIPLTVQSGRPSSRSSLHSSGSIGSYGNRRPSSAPQPGSKGVLVSTSRTDMNFDQWEMDISYSGERRKTLRALSINKGSRRPSLASVHSTSSSIRSYSMMRFEKEIQQKEIRQEMKLRLARLQQQQHYSQNRPQIIVGDAISQGAIAKIIIPTPSPLTPNSLDELLPSVDESQEIFMPKLDRSGAIPRSAAYNGPCSSSSEAL